jgi:hypothetical protein
MPQEPATIHEAAAWMKQIKAETKMLFADQLPNSPFERERNTDPHRPLKQRLVKGEWVPA